MQIFSKIYNKILIWAQSKYAIYWLIIVSFLESFIMPYPPPDAILAPMAFKTPNKAYKLAFICTVFSVTGGIVGYLIGSYAIELTMPFIEKMNYGEKLITIKNWFDNYGVLIIIIAGFSPIPYKIFTIAAGITSMTFLPFVLTSFLARGARFFLLVFMVLKFGEKFDSLIQKYIDRTAYILIIILVIWYLST